MAQNVPSKGCGIIGIEKSTLIASVSDNVLIMGLGYVVAQLFEVQRLKVAPKPELSRRTS